MVEFADVGCGYGGLTVALAKAFPEKYVVGMEIRDKVTYYVKDRIRKLRASSTAEGFVACVRVKQLFLICATLDNPPTTIAPLFLQMP